jgi:hypothetical protein
MDKPQLYLCHLTSAGAAVRIVPMSGELPDYEPFAPVVRGIKNDRDAYRLVKKSSLKEFCRHCPNVLECTTGHICYIAQIIRGDCERCWNFQDCENLNIGTYHRHGCRTYAKEKNEISVPDEALVYLANECIDHILRPINITKTTLEDCAEPYLLEKALLDEFHAKHPNYKDEDGCPLPKISDEDCPRKAADDFLTKKDLSEKSAAQPMTINLNNPVLREVFRRGLAGALPETCRKMLCRTL